MSPAVMLSPAVLLPHRYVFFDAIFVTATSSKVVLLGYCEVMVALYGSADSLGVVCEGPGVCLVSGGRTAHTSQAG